MVLVTSLQWGTVVVSDGKTYKDCIVTPTNSRNWNWSNDGTSHIPGITVEAILPLLQYRTIVLSKGMHEKLRVCPETIRLLEKHRIDYHILQSNDAVAHYNSNIRKGIPTALLLHSTC